jgi:hypothetical protein
MKDWRDKILGVRIEPGEGEIFTTAFTTAHLTTAPELALPERVPPGVAPVDWEEGIHQIATDELPELYTCTGPQGVLTEEKIARLVVELKDKWVEVQGRRWTAAQLAALPWTVEIVEDRGRPVPHLTEYLCTELDVRHPNEEEFSRRCMWRLISALYLYRMASLNRAAFVGVFPDSVYDSTHALPPLPTGYHWRDGVPTRTPGERYVDKRTFGPRAGEP